MEIASRMLSRELEGKKQNLRWDEVTLDLTGWYKLDQHKNVNKGIKAEGPLA